MSPQTLYVRSPAKTNLFLHVGASGDNGLHQIQSLLTTVSVYDTISLSSCAKTNFSADISSLNTKDNLCWQALLALREATHLPLSVSITLKKALPIGGGLGGGSGNAAAVLVGVNRLLELGLSDDDLVEIAVRLGSDVPFFIQGGVQLATGYGHELVQVDIPWLERLWFVLVNPGLGVSTRRAYDELDKARQARGELPGSVGSIDLGALAALSVENLPGILSNDFEETILARYPALAEIKKSLVALGAAGALLCGSGSTMFGLFTNERTAVDARAHLANEWPWVVAGRAAQGLKVDAG